MDTLGSVSATAMRSRRYALALSLLVIACLGWANSAKTQALPQIIPEFSVHTSNLPSGLSSSVVLQIRNAGSTQALNFGDDFNVSFDFNIATITPETQVSLQVGSASGLLASDFAVISSTAVVSIGYRNSNPKTFQQNESIFLNLIVHRKTRELVLWL